MLCDPQMYTSDSNLDDLAHLVGSDDPERLEDLADVLGQGDLQVALNSRENFNVGDGLSGPSNRAEHPILRALLRCLGRTL